MVLAGAVPCAVLPFRPASLSSSAATQQVRGMDRCRIAEQMLSSCLLSVMLSCFESWTKLRFLVSRLFQFLERQKQNPRGKGCYCPGIPWHLQRLWRFRTQPWSLIQLGESNQRPICLFMLARRGRWGQILQSIGICFLYAEWKILFPHFKTERIRVICSYFFFDVCVLILQIFIVIIATG